VGLPWARLLADSHQAGVLPGSSPVETLAKLQPRAWAMVVGCSPVSSNWMAPHPAPMPHPFLASQGHDQLCPFGIVESDLHDSLRSNTEKAYAF
jgi:hypothetical protein